MISSCLSSFKETTLIALVCKSSEWDLQRGEAAVTSACLPSPAWCRDAGPEAPQAVPHRPGAPGECVRFMAEFQGLLWVSPSNMGLQDALTGPFSSRHPSEPPPTETSTPYPTHIPGWQSVVLQCNAASGSKVSRESRDLG